MQNPIKLVRQKYDNYMAYRRQRESDRMEFMSELTHKLIHYGFDDIVHVVEPGKRRFLDRNSTSYFELEHKYGTHTWIYVAVNIISEKSGVPDLVMMDEDKQPIEMQEELIPPEPNPVITWNDTEQLISVWLELTGNAYLWHDREDNTFWPLRPSRMRVVIGNDNRSIKGYAYNRTNNQSMNSGQLNPVKKDAWMYDDPECLEVTQKEWDRKLKELRGFVHKGIAPVQAMDTKEDWVPLEPEDVLHFKYISPTNDLYGISPLYPLLTNLQSDLYARQWNKSFFENGAMPPGVLIVPKRFREEEFSAFKKRFHDQFGGAKNHGKPIVLQGAAEGTQYMPFPNQHKDLDYLNLLTWSRDEILAVFGVPHVMANAHMATSHTSSLSPGIREMRKIFWQDTMMPKMTMRANVWNKHFMLDSKKPPHLGYDYSMIQDLKPDYAELAKSAALLIKSGMTLQEVREMLGLPPEHEGDLFLPMNMMRITNNKTDNTMTDDMMDDDE